MNPTPSLSNADMVHFLGPIGDPFDLVPLSAFATARAPLTTVPKENEAMTSQSDLTRLERALTEARGVRKRLEDAGYPRRGYTLASPWSRRYSWRRIRRVMENCLTLPKEPT